MPRLAGETPPNVALCVQRLRRAQAPPLLLLRGESEHKDGPLKVVLGLEWAQAMRFLRWREAEAVVLDEVYATSLNALERWQRGACSPWRLSEALSDLYKRCRWTQTQLGQAIHKSREYVADVLTLGHIQPEVREFIRSHQRNFPLTFRHLRSIGRHVPAKQRAFAEKIIRERLSSKQLEQQHKTGFAKTSALVEVGRSKRGRPKKRSPQEWRNLQTALQQETLRLEQHEQRQITRIERKILEMRLKQRQIRLQNRNKRRWIERQLKRIHTQLEQGQPTAMLLSSPMQPKTQKSLGD